MTSILKQATSLNNNTFLQFIAEVEFGIPSKDCRNFGICRINIYGEYGNCKHAAQAIVSIFNQNIELDFLKSTINSATYKKFFSKERFLVVEEFLYKKGNYSFYIRKGNYPIIENDSLIKVVFHT